MSKQQFNQMSASIEILTFTALQIKTGPPSLIALGRRIGLVSHKKLHGFHPDYTLTIVCNITVYEQIKVTSSGNDCFKICDQISEEQYHEDIGRLFVNGDFTDHHYLPGGGVPGPPGNTGGEVTSLQRYVLQ